MVKNITGSDISNLAHRFPYKRRYGATQLIASYVFVIPRRNPLEILQFAVPSHVVLCVWPLFNVHK